jgi:hypothetical protein
MQGAALVLGGCLGHGVMNAGAQSASTAMAEQQVATANNPRRRQRPKRRELRCLVHPEQRIAGNGRKYYLHLLTAEELKQRGMSDKKARLVIQAYPVLVINSEWLEELFCPECGCSRWHHVSRQEDGGLSLRWAERELWQQVAHVDPLQPNPTVSEYTRRQARRLQHRRPDGRRFFCHP